MKDSNLELIEKEYFHLQTQIESFDEKSLTIKAWSVTLAAGIAGSNSFTSSNILLLFGAIVSIMFWIIDASWKSFQYANYKRVWQIEKFMRGEISEIKPLQIATSWSESYHSEGISRFFKILFWRHVFFPHGAMYILFLLLFLYLTKG